MQHVAERGKDGLFLVYFVHFKGLFFILDYNGAPLHK